MNEQFDQQAEYKNPVVVVDTREQAPLTFTRLESIRAGLDTGDYSVLGLEHHFAIERKTIPDLVQSVTTERERFERELVRLRGYRFRRLLIIGNRMDVEQHRYQSKAVPKAILNTLAAFEMRYDLPVVWTATPETGAAQIESWAWWFTRETLKVASAIHAD